MRAYSTPLAKGRNRKLQMRLLGGVMMWVTSLYCEPKRRLLRDSDKRASGLQIELAQFGFEKKASPGVETRVARAAALCPSFELAQAELNRDGLDLSVKAVRRIAQHCGEDLLKHRTDVLTQWRAGLLKSTDELALKQAN